MAAFEPASLAREFAAYHLALSPVQLRQVETYLDLLLRWNRRVNLTAIRDPRRMIRELFAESMYLGTVLPLSGRLLDIGSGAGFPGLALKILQPHLAVTLVESNQRKCTFLEEAASVLQLSDVEVAAGRFEEIVRQLGTSFDLATTRAVAMSLRVLSSVGQVLMGGGRVAVFTTSGGASKVAMLKSGFEWGPPVDLPGTASRVILLGTKPS